MLKINALKLEINTSDGLYGVTIPFAMGLNIVRGDNTTGKSTIFQSLLYALGFEELLGGKNEKTMQSVLKDEVIGNDAKKHKVLQSFVLLEIENKSVVTIRRSVVSEKRSSVLMDVIQGPFITKPDGNYEVNQMYVHDRGSASDEIYGFHAFLEEFLRCDLPEVITTSGDFTKLYLPLIAPSFIIEQKSGWSDFFATQPYYAVKNAEARVVEFLLNLEVFQNERRKQIVIADKRVIEEKWRFVYDEFKKIAEKSSSELVGLSENPAIINNINEIYFRTIRSGRSYLLPEVIEEMASEYNTMVSVNNSESGINVERLQSRLDEMTATLNRYNFRMEQLVNENYHEKEKLKQYILQRKNVEEDLKNNKSALKMVQLGADLPTTVAESVCPTCGNELKDSLLPKESHQRPMQLEENIAFLEAQKKMVDIFVQGQRTKIMDADLRIGDYKTQLTSLRQQIRLLKKDLIADDRLPSEAEIEEKINLRKLVEFYTETLESVEQLKEQIAELSKKWEAVLKTEKNLPRDFFSSQDKAKLQALQDNLIALLKDFNYSSKERDAIRISYEKYLPVIQMPLENNKLKTYDIRFDSSGSDFIRCIWAYYVALMKTSIQHDGCHPNLLVFDEPQQQSASNKDFNDFLKVLSGFTSAQIIVFASFQNSDEDFKHATAGVNFNLIRRLPRFIQKVESPGVVI